jgi:hypothetical protein
VDPVIYEGSAWTPAFERRRGGSPAVAEAVHSEIVHSVDEVSPNFRCRACGASWPDPRRVRATLEIREHFMRLRASLGGDHAP